MDQAIGVRHRGGKVGAANGPACAEARGEARAELRRTRAVDVEDRELFRAHRQRRMRDRGAGAAGAELHHAVELHIGQTAAEALGEARPIGVMPDEPAILYHDGVHRIERARIIGQFVSSGMIDCLHG